MATASNSSGDLWLESSSGSAAVSSAERVRSGFNLGSKMGKRGPKRDQPPWQQLASFKLHDLVILVQHLFSLFITGSADGPEMRAHSYLNRPFRLGVGPAAAPSQEHRLHHFDGFSVVGRLAKAQIYETRFASLAINHRSSASFRKTVSVTNIVLLRRGQQWRKLHRRERDSCCGHGLTAQKLHHSFLDLWRRKKQWITVNSAIDDHVSAIAKSFSIFLSITDWRPRIESSTDEQHWNI